MGSAPNRQLEALPPDVLANLLDGEIRGYLDAAILEADRVAEIPDRRTIARELPSAGGAA